MTSSGESVVIVPERVSLEPLEGGAGRPSIWRDSIGDEMREYVDATQDFVIPTPFGDKTKPNLPWIYVFAKRCGIAHRTLQDWRQKIKQKKERTIWEIKFLDAYDYLEAECTARILNKGLGGEYNPKLATFILNTKLGYIPKTEEKVTHQLSGFGLGHNELKTLESSHE